MDYLETLLSRNDEFARGDFDATLKMLPPTRTLIVGCVDPRVDPARIFGLGAGEAAVYRNVGGRVNAPLIEAVRLLRTLGQAVTGNAAAGLNLVVLHHTDCGVKQIDRQAPELLAKHLGVTPDGLDALAVNDPYESVKVDVAKLRVHLDVPGGHTVCGLVYDVANGRVETVVPPTLLGPEGA